MNNADRIEELKIRQLTNQYLVQPAEKKTVIRDLCGVQAQFMEELHDGDMIEVYWKPL